MLVNHAVTMEQELSDLSPRFDAAAEAARIKRARKPRPQAHVLERPAQESVVAWLRAVLPAGSRVFAVVNEAPAKGTGFARARFYQKRRKAGVLDGMPDLGIILPGGECAWVEMKRPVGGELRADQAELHRELRALGHRVGVATCIDTARHLLREWGVPLRESAAEPSRAAKVRVQKARAVLDDVLPL